MASLVTNLGILFSFKYYDFAVDSLQTVFAPWSLFRHLPELEVLLPVGISFYTFQSLGYTIEVYRGNRVSDGRRRLNIAVVFLLSGLWHGAAWTFVLWEGCTAC